MTSAPHASPCRRGAAPGASASHQAPRGRTFNPDWHLDRHEVARLYEWLEWRGNGIGLDDVGYFIAHAEEWRSEYAAMVADEERS